MIISILASVMFVSLTSLIGVVFLGSTSRISKMLPFLVSLAVGALLGSAFFDLIPESFEHLDAHLASILILSGICAFYVLEKFLWHHHHTCNDRGSTCAHPVSMTITLGDALHNLIDGVLIAASYLTSFELGIATTIAVALHEIPQELGDFGVLITSGLTVRKALMLNFASSLSAFVGAGLVLLLSETAHHIAESLVPVAAGGFIYIALSDLVPELHTSRGTRLWIELFGLAIGLGAMSLLGGYA